MGGYVGRRVVVGWMCGRLCRYLRSGWMDVWMDVGM